MRTIAEMNMLLRVRVELPVGMRLATDEFREGWRFVRTGNAPRLKKKIQTRGWNFIKISDESVRSGVGDTSQEAIACALKLALRRVSERHNAVEIEHIELTTYPWFYLARVRVHPYRIQLGAVLAVSDQPAVDPIPSRSRRLPSQAAELFPHFGSAMPMLKELVIASRSSQARAQ